MKIRIVSLLASVAAGSVLASPAAAQHAGHSPTEPQQSVEAQAAPRQSANKKPSAIAQWGIRLQMEHANRLPSLKPPWTAPRWIIQPWIMVR